MFVVALSPRPRSVTDVAAASDGDGFAVQAGRGRDGSGERGATTEGNADVVAGAAAEVGVGRRGSDINGVAIGDLLRIAGDRVGGQHVWRRHIDVHGVSRRGSQCSCNRQGNQFVLRHVELTPFLRLE